jgi:Dickkopf N-terminal cysteine-rich region
MLRTSKIHLCLAVSVLALAVSGMPAYAADECQADKDCTGGMVCILALSPHACKAPQAAGAACKRDAVCASNKCDIPAGKDAGICK